MDYRIIGNTTCPIAEISLKKNETIKIERGAMAYLSDVRIEGTLNSRGKGFGGLLGAVGRSLTSGESMFITQAMGESDAGVIGIAPASPGRIAALTVSDGKSYRLNTGAFVACDASVNYVMKKQSLEKAFFAGTGGLFVMETEGTGKILISAFGDMVELTVTEGRPLTIDNDHVVAWSSSLDYNIEIASGAFGFTTGEGLVNRFRGNGKVLIQTRNIHSLADILNPYITKGE